MKTSTEISFNLSGSYSANQQQEIQDLILASLKNHYDISEIAVTVHAEEVKGCPCRFCTSERKRTPQAVTDAIMRDIHRSAYQQEFVEMLFALCPDVRKEEILSAWSKSI